jgi:hypothetical protein
VAGGGEHDDTLQRRTPVPFPHRVLAVSGPAADPTPYDERLGDLEAAALLRAFAAGNASLVCAQDRLDAACDEVVEAYRAAQLSIDAVVRYTASGSAALARDAADRVARRHARDGPEDRRRRPVWPWLGWATVALAATFDSTFVGNLVQRVLGVDSGSLTYYLAYLPGVGMALCLYVAGTVLGAQLFRRRSRVERRSGREADDVPPPRLFGPVVGTVAIVGLLGTGAYVRAVLGGEGFADLADLQPVFVILLVLTSIAAVAVKALSHNPFADSARDARGQTERATREATALVEQARASQSRHARTWVRLRSTIASAEGNARRVLEQACARILEDRWHRGAGGPLQLPLALPRWPRDPDEPYPDAALPVLEFELLDHARVIAQRYHPDRLDRTLTEVVDLLHAQFQNAVPPPAEWSAPHATKATQAS